MSSVNEHANEPANDQQASGLPDDASAPLAPTDSVAAGSAARGSATGGSGPRRWSSQTLLMIGGVAALIGIMSLGLAVALHAKNGHSPLALLLVALLSPAGFAVAFAGLMAQSRERGQSR